MADVTPNYKVEMQRLRAQIASQLSTIEAQKLAILEMADRSKRHEENIVAAEAAMVAYREQLAGLEATHGGVSHG